MHALDKKLMRDMRRLWAQALAVSLVLACGVATLILAVGSHQSLNSTRAAYYDHNSFGHVFASARRAPLSLGAEIARLDGVLAYQLRIAERALLDIPGMAEPASASVLSIPDTGTPRLNVPYLRQGRLPAAGRPSEVLVSEPFANAHGFRPGSGFSGTVNGQRINFEVTGVALSPEFIYALGPGDLVPDDRRFGIIWMRRTALEAVANMEGGFNSLSLRLLPKQPVEPVLAAIDRLLKPYGGTGAISRDDQTSHAFLDSELSQLEAMARVIPPIFLLVSAFLVNMILSRLISLEREQIGLLKALGYFNLSVAWHYVKLVLVIAVIGIIIGWLAGTWLGDGMTRLYARFFRFPYFIFERDPAIYLLAALASAGAAIAGALKAAYTAAALPPAAAMQPAPPTRYNRSGVMSALAGKLASNLVVMGLRHCARWPVRTAMATVGNSMAVGLLITAMFSFGAIDYMIDTVFFRAERQDATISFTHDLAPRAMIDTARLPGVLTAEPFRSMPARVAHGSRSEQVAISGQAPDADLSRLLDLDLDPVKLPSNGLVLSEWLANRIDARVGDLVSVELLEEGGRHVQVPVTMVNQTFMGMTAHMDIAYMDRLSLLGPRRSGAHVRIDMSRLDEAYSAIKEMPAAASLALRNSALHLFRSTIQQNIYIMTTVYVVLAVAIAFGVVYNSARIQLSERARELASLRVLGFTEREVAIVLIAELAVIVLLAQPLGWVLGTGFSWVVVQGFQSDLFRVPFVLQRSALGWSSTVVVAASIISSLLVIRRVHDLNLVQVLKTRE